MQAARLRAVVGRDHRIPLRRRESEAPPVPLRRAGELARTHRGAAGEQRLPHPAGDARGHDVEGRARPRRAVAGLERGARPAALVGSAVVAADAADRRVRVGPARVRRPVRGLEGRRGQGRRDQGRRPRGDRPHPRDGRRGRGGRVGLPEVGAGLVARAAPPPDGVRRGRRRGREQVHRDRAEPADGRRGRRNPHRRQGGRGVREGRDPDVARRDATPPRSTTRSTRCATPRRPTRT